MPGLGHELPSANDRYQPANLALDTGSMEFKFPPGCESLQGGTGRTLTLIPMQDHIVQLLGVSPIAGRFNIQQYVTGKSLDGLYQVIGEEEKKIPQDPVGTGSAILMKLFGAM